MIVVTKEKFMEEPKKYLIEADILHEEIIIIMAEGRELILKRKED